MGVVDLARDEDGHEVALKRLALHGTPEELARARRRIRREAEVLEALRHPNVVRLREVIDEGDDIVLVMDHLPGGNLAQQVAERGPLPPGEVQLLADRLLDALAAAHRLGIVHRDIKPANVLYDDAGLPYLADFGVAAHRDATPGLTAPDLALGTPGFMAPEQARGEDSSPATDVFSLGATLRFAATGAGPFGTGDPRVLMARAASGRAERVPTTVPEPLRSTIVSMLAADPAARPSAAAARGGTSGGDHDPGTRFAEPVSPRTPRDRRTVATVAVIALAVAAGLLVVLRGGTPSDPPDDGPAATTPARPTTTECTPLPFQPCGERPAPNTDGRRCTDGFADYDDDPANGCEAAPDELVDGDLLEEALVANLVPTDDVDTYRIEVSDRFQLDCGGEVHVTLTAPTGISQRITVTDEDGEELGTAVSGDGEPAEVTIGDPRCGSDDGGSLLVLVESIGSDRSPDDYELAVRGSF
jgi:hypothetical protein